MECESIFSGGNIPVNEILNKLNSPDQKKVNVFHAIFEVNSIIGEVWDFMAQFDDKYGDNYQYLKILFKNFAIDKYFLYISVYTAILWQNLGTLFWSGRILKI